MPGPHGCHRLTHQHGTRPSLRLVLLVPVPVVGCSTPPEPATLKQAPPSRNDPSQREISYGTEVSLLFLAPGSRRQTAGATHVAGDTVGAGPVFLRANRPLRVAIRLHGTHHGRHDAGLESLEGHGEPGLPIMITRP